MPTKTPPPSSGASGSSPTEPKLYLLAVPDGAGNFSEFIVVAEVGRISAPAEGTDPGSGFVFDALSKGCASVADSPDTLMAVPLGGGAGGGTAGLSAMMMSSVEGGQSSAFMMNSFMMNIVEQVTITIELKPNQDVPPARSSDTPSDDTD